jgi:hypothetical protein
VITLLALNNFQKAGIATAVLLVLGWMAYLAGYLRKEDTPPPGAEMELAPNRRPYFDDGGWKARASTAPCCGASSSW